MTSVQKEVQEIVDRWKGYVASKTVDAQSEQIIIDLDQLNEVEFNKDLLQATGIARYLAPLKNCASSDVRRRAADLFQKILDAGRKQAVPMRSTSREDLEAKRKRFRDIFYSEFQKAEKELKEKPVISANELAIAVEKAIWETSDREERVKRLAMALSDPVKTEELQFAKRLLMGTLKPERFASFESGDLMTDAQIQKIQQDKEDTINRNTVPKAPFSHSANFKCRRCGSDWLRHEQMQTRSADEPMTNFLECGNCGHKWKE